MKLRNAVLTFSDEDGNNHEAFFCFYKERGSGIRTNINSENPWLTMINATPQEVVTEVKANYGVDLSPFVQLS